MSQNNPFAKLGALDQMLYQDTLQKPKEHNGEDVSEQQQKEKPVETSLLTNQQGSKLEKKQTSEILLDNNLIVAFIIRRNQ